MTFRIAAFNVENLFDRANAFNQDIEVARSTIQATTKLNALFEEQIYTAARKRKILQLCEQLQFNKYNEGPYAFLRTIRGKLIVRPIKAPAHVVANGRDDWIGWVELKTAPVDETAIENTARVIRDVRADILAVVEAESRPVLKKFTQTMFNKVVKELPRQERPLPYENFMLIDGNDDRGIDVGIETKAGFEIKSIKSHVTDLVPGTRQRVFSRDCPEYEVITPAGETILVLPNHFKSKFGGDNSASRNKRRLQATRVAEIYNELRAAGHELVVVLGDLNDTPDSEALRPLFANTDLKDVSEHSHFEVGQFNRSAGNTNRGIGTFRLGNDNDKIDYILVSPALFKRVSKAGLFRKGAWPGTAPPRWDVYPQLKKEIHVASDHHVMWLDID